MKVVRTSNYDDEGPGGDQYVVSGTEGLTEEEAQAKAGALNDDPRCPDANYYVAKPDDYVPWRFEP